MGRLCSRMLQAGMAGAALLLASALFAGEVPVAFGTHGGDVWGFHKSIDVTVPAHRCDHVAISSPLATIVLSPRHGHVRARLPLQPGSNQLEATCRAHGVIRGEARQDWLVRLRNAPMASIGVVETSGRLTLDARGSTPAPVRAAAISRYRWQGDGANPTALAGLPASGRRIDLPNSAPDGDYKVTLDTTDAAGRSDETAVLLRAHDHVLRAVDVAHDHAAWIDRAVVYGVIPKLFGPHGLADVTARLDQLADLGVTALWLSPIMDSPAGDFGYAVTDYFRLRQSLGDEDELRDLIRAAHARGLRVILDFVPNHLSDRNAYFTDTVAQGRASPYFDFFARDRSGRAEHYFNWNNLENLNYANPEVQRFVIAASEYWVREFGIDGFRVDAAWGPRQRAPDFWPRWRAALKRIKPDLLLLAEASVRDPYYGGHGFDAAYDWTDKLGEWAWGSAFVDQAHTAERLRAAIEASSSSKALVFRFLDNNDTGARFISRYGLDTTRIATAMLLTLPGIPSLYTGEDVGAAYEPYKASQPIAWDDADHLRDWYKRLIALRSRYPVLRSRDIRFIDVPSGRNVLAYVRPGATVSDSIVVILNYGVQPVAVTLGDDVVGSTGRRIFHDLLDGDKVRIEEPTVTIAPHSVRILKLG